MLLLKRVSVTMTNHLWYKKGKGATLLLPTSPTQKMLPTLGARSFAAIAPALWNKLPADIRNVASSK